MIGLLIPGIGVAYNKLFQSMRAYPIFHDFCNRANIDRKYLNATFDTNDIIYWISDSLENQKRSYVINCAMSDIYRTRGISFNCIVGYSMGIYAALYAGGFYSFETGLGILENAFQMISSYCRNIPTAYGMAIILGLNEHEMVKHLISRFGTAVEISVFNGKRAFVISGEVEQVQLCMEYAVQMGAMGVRSIYTQHPYHSSILKGVNQLFIDYLGSIEFLYPKCNVFSPIDGELISKNNVADIISCALYTPLHFDRVIELLVSRHGVTTCYETGPKDSMKKLVRYINKNVTVHQFI
ncbi:MAG: hypothetical protein WA151_14015 [Desulfatirhabdiaceae bacterium]